MKTQTIEYFDGSQKLLGQLFHDGNITQKKPAILIFPAFEGPGDFTTDYAQKLVAQGYVALVADIYGDGASSNTWEGCLQLYGTVANDRKVVRTRAVLAYETLLKQAGVDQTKIGAIGFCFGGVCLLEVARSGANLRAGVCAHTPLAKSDLPTGAVKTKLLILNGYQDPQIPHATIDDFAKEMAAVNVNDWMFAYFGDAKHSFTDHRVGTMNPVIEKERGREYNKLAADRTFRFAVDMFAEQLG